MSLDAKSLYSSHSRPAHDSEKASPENNNHHHCEHCQTNTSCRNNRLRRLLLPAILTLVVLCGLILAWRFVNWYGLSSRGLGVDNLVGRGITLPPIPIHVSPMAGQYLSWSLILNSCISTVGIFIVAVIALVAFLLFLCRCCGWTCCCLSCLCCCC